VHDLPEGAFRERADRLRLREGVGRVEKSDQMRDRARLTHTLLVGVVLNA